MGILLEQIDDEPREVVEVLMDILKDWYETAKNLIKPCRGG